MKTSMRIMSGVIVSALVIVTSGYLKIDTHQTENIVENQVADKTNAVKPIVEEKHQELLTVPESEYPVVENHGSFWRYTSLDELYQNAEIVAEVVIASQETITVDYGTVATRSQAAVSKVYKGDTVPATLTITEAGGVLDLSKLPRIDKPGAGLEPKNAPSIVESALEGSPVMKPTNSYFVFLTKNPLEKWGYNIVGSIQGKLKIDSKTQKIVNTVDPSHLVQDDVFFLQKQLNGKYKTEVDNTIKQIR